MLCSALPTGGDLVFVLTRSPMGEKSRTGTSLFWHVSVCEGEKIAHQIIPMTTPQNWWQANKDAHPTWHVIAPSTSVPPNCHLHPKEPVLMIRSDANPARKNVFQRCSGRNASKDNFHGVTSGKWGGYFFPLQSRFHCAETESLLNASALKPACWRGESEHITG